jgi:hypothetical protein
MINLRRLLALAAVTLTGFSASAQAQEIILFDLPNFQGQSLTVNRETSNLAYQRFNDRTSSFRIVSGQWELCMDDNFDRQCAVYHQDQNNMGHLDNLLTSLRPVYQPGPGDNRGSGRGGRRGDLTLYSGPNYTGRSVTLDSATPNFGSVQFNDMARSVRYDGRRSWRVCQHINYGGACTEISGDVPVLGRGIAGQISSAEPDGGSRRGGNRPRTGVWLYDGADFEGQRVDVVNDVANLESARFNDRADSLIVARGETWEICEHSNFRGRCEYFDSDRVGNLRGLGLRNIITSLRRVDEIYGQPGSGYPGPGGGNNQHIQGAINGVNSTFFPRPEINGYSIDRCMGGQGRNCDAQTAQRICRSTGHRNVAHYEVEQSYRQRTWFLGRNRQCDSGQCAAIVDVLCTD